jgi:integrase
MAYEKINFSRATLSGLPVAPAGKRLYYSDIKEPGLLLCVTANGTKSFQVYQKIAGRPIRVTLGRFSNSLADSVEIPRGVDHKDFLSNTPELNVRMARTLAGLVKVDLKSGINPSDAKKANRDELTLGELFDEYEKRHLIAMGKKRVSSYREMFERILGELPKTDPKKHGMPRKKSQGSVNWQNRRISTITRHEIQKVISDVGTMTGPQAANHALTLIRSMYNRAIEWGMFTKANPAVGVKKFRLRTRDRFMQTDELPRFFESVSLEPSQAIKDYVVLALLTGARKMNVLRMRWDEVNLDRREWRMSDTKNGEPLTVPLMPEAVEILKSRKISSDSDFVFPGKGKTGHLMDAKAGWKRILDRAELLVLTERIKAAGIEFEWPIASGKSKSSHGRTLEKLSDSLARARRIATENKIDTTGAKIHDLRMHDMRRTLGSYQAATGASLVIIGKSLGHKDVASTAIYSRLNLDPVRESMETATRVMLAAGGLLPLAEVVPFEKQRKKSG